MRRLLASAARALPIVGLLLFASSAGAEQRIEVQRGDSWWSLAKEHGCSVERLQAANRSDSEFLQIGQALVVPKCTRVGDSSPAATHHRVKPGETLSQLARRYGTSVGEIRRLNRIDGSVIRVGQELRVPGAKGHTQVRVVPGQSIGRPTRGELRSPARLSRGSGYHLRRPERTFAAQHVVDQLELALGAARRGPAKGLPPVAIGDLSARSGGPISGHRSHQSGRDVDVGLYFRRAPRGYPAEFVPGDAGPLHESANWVFLESLLSRRGKPGGVERVFLDYELQERLYKAARKAGRSAKSLRPIFQYPDGRYARGRVVQHVSNHHDHFHVRFACPAGDAKCE